MSRSIHQYSSDSSSDSDPSFVPKLRQSIKIHVVQAKLSPEAVEELYSLIDGQSVMDINSPRQFNLELRGDVSDADVIITNIHMRKRLERHLDWKIARQKAIVTPEWLRDSVQQGRSLPCGDYAALKELHDNTVENCPEPNSTNPALPANPDLLSLNFTDKAVDVSEKVKSNYKLRYSCARATPLVCPNQALVSELEVLQLSRKLEGKEISALAYERAIAVVKAYPHIITLRNLETEVHTLPYLGEKIISKIKEFLKTTYIEESQMISTSDRFKALSAFTMVHGVGPSTARMLYDIGLRTIRDMERYYDMPTGSNEPEMQGGDIFTPNGQRIPGQTQIPNLSIPVALTLRNDLQTKIPRTEVEEIHKVVMAELNELQQGCISTIVGGYRRGKLESNDIDIVIGYPYPQKGSNIVKGLCTALVQRLYDQGLVTHVMHKSGFHAHNSLRTSNWDSLEKALTVFVLPPDGKRTRIKRRLDLIFAAPEAYWTAVVGWTGSKMFERDLRLWAKLEKGMKFDSSGLTRLHDSHLLFPRTEKEVFDMLDLEWIDPILRNANV